MTKCARDKETHVLAERHRRERISKTVSNMKTLLPADSLPPKPQVPDVLEAAFLYLSQLVKLVQACHKFHNKQWETSEAAYYKTQNRLLRSILRHAGLTDSDELQLMDVLSKQTAVFSRDPHLSTEPPPPEDAPEGVLDLTLDSGHDRPRIPKRHVAHVIGDQNRQVINECEPDTIRISLPATEAHENNEVDIESHVARLRPIKPRILDDNSVSEEVTRKIRTRVIEMVHCGVTKYASPPDENPQSVREDRNEFQDSTAPPENVDCDVSEANQGENTPVVVLEYNNEKIPIDRKLLRTILSTFESTDQKSSIGTSTDSNDQLTCSKTSDKSCNTETQEFDTEDGSYSIRHQNTEPPGMDSRIETPSVENMPDFVTSIDDIGPDMATSQANWPRSSHRRTTSNLPPISSLSSRHQSMNMVQDQNQYRATHNFAIDDLISETIDWQPEDLSREQVQMGSQGNQSSFSIQQLASSGYKTPAQANRSSNGIVDTSAKCFSIREITGSHRDSGNRNMQYEASMQRTQSSQNSRSCHMVESIINEPPQLLKAQDKSKKRPNESPHKSTMASRGKRPSNNESTHLDSPKSKLQRRNQRSQSKQDSSSCSILPFWEENMVAIPPERLQLNSQNILSEGGVVDTSGSIGLDQMFFNPPSNSFNPNYNWYPPANMRDSQPQAIQESQLIQPVNSFDQLLCDLQPMSKNRDPSEFQGAFDNIPDFGEANDIPSYNTNFFLDPPVGRYSNTLYHSGQNASPYRKVQSKTSSGAGHLIQNFATSDRQARYPDPVAQTSAPLSAPHFLDFSINTQY